MGGKSKIAEELAEQALKFGFLRRGDEFDTLYRAVYGKTSDEARRFALSPKMRIGAASPEEPVGRYWAVDADEIPALVYGGELPLEDTPKPLQLITQPEIHKMYDDHRVVKIAKGDLDPNARVAVFPDRFSYESEVLEIPGLTGMEASDSAKITRYFKKKGFDAVMFPDPDSIGGGMQLVQLTPKKVKARLGKKEALIGAAGAAGATLTSEDEAEAGMASKLATRVSKRTAKALKKLHPDALKRYRELPEVDNFSNLEAGFIDPFGRVIGKGPAEDHVGVVEHLAGVEERTFHGDDLRDFIKDSGLIRVGEEGFEIYGRPTNEQIDTIEKLGDWFTQHEGFKINVDVYDRQGNIKGVFDTFNPRKVKYGVWRLLDDPEAKGKNLGTLFGTGAAASTAALMSEDEAEAGMASKLARQAVQATQRLGRHTEGIKGKVPKETRDAILDSLAYNPQRRDLLGKTRAGIDELAEHPGVEKIHLLGGYTAPKEPVSDIDILMTHAPGTEGGQAWIRAMQLENEMPKLHIQTTTEPNLKRRLKRYTGGRSGEYGAQHKPIRILSGGAAGAGLSQSTPQDDYNKGLKSIERMR